MLPVPGIAGSHEQQFCIQLIHCLHDLINLNLISSSLFFFLFRLKSFHLFSLLSKGSFPIPLIILVALCTWKNILSSRVQNILWFVFLNKQMNLQTLDVSSDICWHGIRLLFLLNLGSVESSRQSIWYHHMFSKCVFYY